MHRLVLFTLLCATLAVPARAAVVFDQPHNGTGVLHKSSWYAPDGLDGDTYCWDSFTLGSSTAISEVHWRGGYEYHPAGTGQSPVTGFEVSIYRSIAAGGQPDVGAGGRLVGYNVTGNSGEAAAGSFGGVALYDYAFTLPSPFQAAAGTTYWVRIVATQGLAAPSFAPDWGLAVGTGGNNQHFRYITGSTYQLYMNDLAFSLHASGAPTVTIAASAAPVGAGTITGAGAYPVGSTASLSASPNAGWGFMNWTENGTQVSANATYSFTASVNRTLVAHFDTAYTVVATPYPAYAGTIAGAGTYTRGATVTLVATPAPGFVFSSWSDGATTATHTFAAAADVQLNAFFASAPGSVTYDFDSTPAMTPFPLYLTVNGLSAYFTGDYSVQQVGTLGIAPLGFYGNCLYPGSVFQSDLVIRFSAPLTYFSILYAVDELACDVSARMRVNAYRAGAFVGTNTMVATAGTYPSATLSLAAPAGFDSVVVHWDAPGTLCQDYGPIFFADNVTVTRAVPVSVGDAQASGGLHVFAPAPNPFRESSAIRFELPRAGAVRMWVYDLDGRRVRRLLDSFQPAGKGNVSWNGLDDGGRRVSPGVYLVRFEAAGRRENVRIVLLQ